MARFHYSYSTGADLLPEGAYMLRILEAIEQESSKGSDMIKLKLTTVPQNKYIWDYLVFHPKSAWVIQAFCRSSGLELPINEADVDLNPKDCLSRICYAELVHERGQDGRTRLVVERYLTRQEALKINPALQKVPLPDDAPPGKKLGPVASGSRVPDVTGARPDPDAEPDDIPFRSRIYRDVSTNRLNRRVM